MPIIDRGWKHYKRQVERLERYDSVYAGLIASMASVEIVMIGVWNHYGTRKNGKRHIPPRPFVARASKRMIKSFRRKSGAVAQGFGWYLNESAMGRSPRPEVPWQMVGGAMKGFIKKEIEELKNPPNAPLTIRRKGFDDPLIHTRRMLLAVSYRISASAG